jgi:hypothetical protein
MTPEKFDDISRYCELQTGTAWDGTASHLHRAIDRQREFTAILEQHAEWLSEMRQRSETAGRTWNTVELRRQSRRDGDLAAVPEWLGAMSEKLTPEWMLNK